jgi:hypothetical protein
VQAEIDACKKIDPARPDSYFNEGILTQEYKAKGAGAKDKTIGVYQQAKQIFVTFMDKASGKPEYDGAVKKAKERMQDMDDMIKFLELPGDSTVAPPASSASPALPSASGAPSGTSAAPASSAGASASPAASAAPASPPGSPQAQPSSSSAAPGPGAKKK